MFGTFLSLNENFLNCSLECNCSRQFHLVGEAITFWPVSTLADGIFFPAPKQRPGNLFTGSARPRHHFCLSFRLLFVPVLFRVPVPLFSHRSGFYPDSPTPYPMVPPTRPHRSRPMTLSGMPTPASTARSHSLGTTSGAPTSASLVQSRPPRTTSGTSDSMEKSQPLG